MDRPLAVGDADFERVLSEAEVPANPRTASRFGIRGIPTLILFRGRLEVTREMGALSRAQVDAILDAA